MNRLAAVLLTLGFVCTVAGAALAHHVAGLLVAGVLFAAGGVLSLNAGGDNR